MRYVGLLRGINVGGNRKVPMAQLRALYESLGFTNVSTYLNSGNIIFNAETEPYPQAIALAMHKEFGFEVPTLIIPGLLIIEIAKAIPTEWNNDALEKTDIIYLFEMANNAEIIEQLGYRPEFEDLRYVNGAILAHLERKHQSKSSLLRVIGTPIFQHMTVRNVNTARKLAELVKDN